MSTKWVPHTSSMLDNWTISFEIDVKWAYVVQQLPHPSITETLSGYVYATKKSRREPPPPPPPPTPRPQILLFDVAPGLIY